MPIWSHDSPPIYFPNAGLTKHGWIDPETREILVAFGGEGENQIGPGTDLVRHIEGVTRIQKRSVHTLAGGTAIQKTATSTQSGLSRLQTSSWVTRTGTSRVQATKAVTRVGLSSVRKTIARTIIGQSAVRHTRAQTLDAAARILQRMPQIAGTKVEYPFFQTSSPDIVKDIYGTNDAPIENLNLSYTPQWTNLGYRVDGNQRIHVPDLVLPNSYRDFTMFLVCTLETGPSISVFAQWDGFTLYATLEDGLIIEVGNTAFPIKYHPKWQSPELGNQFVLVLRFDSAGQRFDVRIAEKTPEHVFAGTVDYADLGSVKFFGNTGVLGPGVIGTFSYFAMFNRYISNGETSALLSFGTKNVAIRTTRSVASRTLTGAASIVLESGRTLMGTSRIQATSLTTRTGMARIQNTVSSLRQGFSRIQKTTETTLQGTSAIA